MDEGAENGLHIIIIIDNKNMKLKMEDEMKIIQYMRFRR